MEKYNCDLLLIIVFTMRHNAPVLKWRLLKVEKYNCDLLLIAFFYCAIHKRTNRSEVFGVLVNADESQTSLYMFMREVGGGGGCD